MSRIVKIGSASYTEQQANYESMANAAGAAAKSENTAAIGAFVGAGISALAAI
ncbi:MAG: hypothetical protein WCD69_18510 [Xanthobacteraceae bacterium]